LNQDIKNNFDVLEFKDQESVILCELLKFGVASASEISAKTGVKRPTVYETLKKFIERGYVNELETNSITKFQIIDPVIIGDKLDFEINKDFKEKSKAVKTLIPELVKLYKSEETDESKIINVELIRGHNRHRDQKFLELFKQAKSEILFMVRLEYLISEEFDELAKKFIKKGGVIKSIYEVSDEIKLQKDNKWSKAGMKDILRIFEGFEKQGEQIKLSSNQLSNTTIFDKKIVYMNIMDKSIPRHNNSDIIIKNSDTAKNMIDLFNYYWNTSYTLSEFKSLHKL